MIVLVTLVVIFSFKMRPVYQATSRVEIESETPQIQSLSDLYRNAPTDAEYLQTQVDVLRSDNLAWETIQQTGLGAASELAGSLHGSEPGRPEWLVARTRRLRGFRKRLQVQPMEDSRMVEVKFESADPSLAARVVNTLVANYIAYNFRKNYDATRQASGWMAERLNELKSRVEESQRALVDYERRNAIVNVDGKQNIVEQKLAELTKEWTQAQSDRMREESLYGAARSGGAPGAFAARDELLGNLQEKYAELKTQYVKALDQYGPKFPEVVRLRDQSNEMQGFVTQEKNRDLRQLGSRYQAAVSREALLAAAVTRQKEQVGRLNLLLIQHNLLKQQFQTNQRLYDRLLEHLKDATISAGLKATNIHVVDPALPPTVPVRPRKLLYAGIALLVGLAVGVIMAFTQESLDNAISGIEEVETLIAAPTLAVVPAARRAREPWMRRNGNHSANGVALSVAREPDSPVAESYRNLRTAILLSTAPRPPQAILVTSTQPLEGKTSTSLNLALTLAQRSSRTLVIDADLRKQGICDALGVRGATGLSGVLTGASILEEALRPVDGVPGLSVLPAGPRPPNPAELLSSPAMEQLLRELRQRFDFLVVDSPPLLPVTDATVLSALVDGVVLVVECRVTDRGALARANRTLENAGARVLGTVLNKIEAHHDGYYSAAYRAYYGSNGRNGAAPEDLVASHAAGAVEHDEKG